MRTLADLRAGGERPGGELVEWINGQPADVLDKLIGWGVIDAKAAKALCSLALHLEDWRDSVRAGGVGSDHVQLVYTRAKRIIDACGFTRFAEIDAEEVKLLLEKWRAREDDPISVQTSNHYLRAIKQFCSWCAERIGSGQSPVAKLKLLNVEAHRKRERRALSLDDLLMLLRTTESGPARGRTSGPERASLYWLAAETGLRAAELRSLTKASFSLDADPPTVTVQAGYAKGRREDTLILSGELAVRLWVHLAAKLPAARAFTVPTRTADMLRSDLERAGLPYRDEAGRVFDFHSLRVQCARDLVRGKAHPKVAQQRLRHKNISLTMDVYAKLSQDDRAAALEALPRLSVGA